MSDPWTSIGAIVGGGGTLGLVAVILVYVTKGAIAKAVTQAGDREMARLKDALATELQAKHHAFEQVLERLKGELARDLEKERQTFAREVESDRQEFARNLEQFKAQLTSDVEARRRDAATTLEQFKAQLTLEAEVRRQVAAKKVAVLLRFIELANGLIRKALFPVLRAEEGHAGFRESFPESIKAMDEYWGAYRDGEAFFDADARQEIMRFGTEMEAARDEYNNRRHEGANAMDASKRAEGSRTRLFQTLRRELQIEMGEKVETSS
jgi:hypothetical protein